MKKNPWPVAGWLFAMLLLTACATGGSARSLLARDYAAMPDRELLTYYARLNTALEEAADDGSFRLGVGLGVGGGDFSVGAGQTVYRDDPSEALRARRNQVRLELARRGLSPLPGPAPDGEAQASP